MNENWKEVKGFEGFYEVSETGIVRTLERYSNRKSKAVELNSDYYKDGLFYVRSMHEKLNMPTLFDLIEENTI